MSNIHNSILFEEVAESASKLRKNPNDKQEIDFFYDRCIKLRDAGLMTMSEFVKLCEDIKIPIF